ncbi:kinase-like protein [Auricularia subglabra TFB-10046 SS5]|nr:kinase-like protein [Auricularia subglabra TFB-10046 SS5]
MAPVPTIKADSGEANGPEVAAPSVATANTDAPTGLKRKGDFVTAALRRGVVLYDLRIWTSRRRGAVFEAEMVCAAAESETVYARVFNAVRNEEIYKLLEREASVLQSLKHPNVLPFYGTCETTGVDQYCFVYPLAPNGTLKDFIINKPNKPAADRRGLVAEGLEYLHSTAGIAHGDLQWENVLISKDNSAAPDR